MTDPDRPETPDVPALAAFEAGELDPERAAQVRRAVQADPRAREVLTALAATRADLAALRDPPVPPAVAARWAAALEQAGRTEPDRPADLTDLTDVTDVTDDTDDTDDTGSADRPGEEAADGPGGRPAIAPERHLHLVPAPPPGRARARRQRGGYPRRFLLAGGLAAAVAAGVVLAGRSGGEELLPVTRVELAAAASAAVGSTDLGPLDAPDRRAECLSAVGGTAPQAVLGGRQVLLDGEPGVLLVLGTGELGRFRVLVVDAACGRGGGRVLADQVVGG